MTDYSLGPWAGRMASRSPEQVPLEYSPGGQDFRHMPHTGGWKRRDGQTIAFDSASSLVGALPALWGNDQYSFPAARIREIQEFKSDGISDGVPTIAALVTKEELTAAADLDDGRFGTLWIRDQVTGLNYTMGSEYSSDTYPAPGASAVQSYRYIPVRYDSGDGALTRGVDEITRRFLASGSRRFLKVGNQWYLPNRNGTPARWLPNATESGEGTAITATGDMDNDPGPGVDTDFYTTVSANFKWGTSCQETPGDMFTTGWQNLADNDGTKRNYVFVNQAAFAGLPCVGRLTCPTLDAGLTKWTLRCVAQLYTGGVAYTGGHELQIFVVLSDGNKYRFTKAVNTFTPVTSGTPGLSPLETIDFDLDTVTTAPVGTGTPNTMTIEITTSGTDSFATLFIMTYLAMIPVGASTDSASYLTPTGPFPPTHAGTCTAGAQIENGESFIYPDADVSDGSWLNASGNGTNLFDSINDTTDDDTDYIQCSPGGTLCEQTLSNFATTPGSDATVTLRYRARLNASFPTVNAGEFLGVDIYEGATLRVRSFVPPTIGFQNFAYQLTAAEISSITDWTNLSIKMSVTGGVTAVRVSRVKIGHTPSTFTATDGGWKGSDRFYRGVAYVFEDDSLWMPTTPRGPNDTLPDGFCLTTVDSANPTATYQKMTWSNLPYLPKGFKGLALLRSDKIDSTTQSTLQLSPFSLKVVAVLPRGVTTYEDFFASDGSLTVDADKLFVRYDHKMPPCARYIAGGAQRVAVMYGKQSPVAITLAPVGASADYDLNVADDSTTAYAARMYVRIALDDDGTMHFALYSSTGTVLTTKNLTTGSTTTLQQLVDQINATSVATDSMQWRAQVCPGANPDAVAMTALVPHIRAISNCVVSGQTISLAGTKLQKVAVGQRVSGSGVTTGAYITKCVYSGGTTTLTFSGTITAGTKNLSFYNELGDGESGDSTADLGYQRVIANSLPGFLYFNNTYLAQFPDEDQAVYMTVANPLSVRSAANCYRSERDQVTNTFRPPRADAGICTGGFGLDNGFVIWYEHKRAVIINTRDQGTGNDADYQMRIRNERRGCPAYNTIDHGADFGVAATPDGIVACDLDTEILLTDAIYKAAISEGGIASGVSGVGDFAVELPASIAAAAADNDKSCMWAKIIRGVLWVGYRITDGAKKCDRVITYDFSTGKQSAGLGALVRAEDLVDYDTGRVIAPAGTLFGWGQPYVYAKTPSAIGAGRRTDGEHIYGWIEDTGSTGDGRIEELESGSTDDGTAIGSAYVQGAWIREVNDMLSFQEILTFHHSPTGSTGHLEFWRGLANVTAAQSLTLTVSGSNMVTQDLKALLLSLRAKDDAGHFRFTQATGSAREWRKSVVKAFPVRDQRLAQ